MKKIKFLLQGAHYNGKESQYINRLDYLNRISNKNNGWGQSTTFIRMLREGPSEEVKLQAENHEKI